MKTFEQWLIFEAITEPVGFSDEALKLIQRVLKFTSDPARRFFPQYYSIYSDGNQIEFHDSTAYNANFIPKDKLIRLGYHQMVDPVMSKGLMQLSKLPEMQDFMIEAGDQKIPLKDIKLKTIEGRYRTYAKQSSKHFPLLKDPYKKPGHWSSAPGEGRKMRPDSSSKKKFKINALFDIYDIPWYHVHPLREQDAPQSLQSIMRNGLKPSPTVLDRSNNNGEVTGISGGNNVETQPVVYVYLDPKDAEEKAKEFAPAVILKIDTSQLPKNYLKLAVDEDVLRPGNSDPVIYDMIRRGGVITMPHFLRSATYSRTKSLGYRGTIPPKAISVLKEVREDKEEDDAA